MPQARTPDVLAKIVAQTVVDLEGRRGQAADIRAAALEARDVRPADRQGFAARLGRANELNVIAEVKRRSPSAGSIAEIPAPLALAQSYQRADAAAISVLTDGPFFGGSLQDLTAVTAGVQVPVLRKDFVVDPLQVYEAAAAGASAFLLIAAILEPAQAWELHCLGQELGLETLFEIHSLAEYEGFDQFQWPVIGINNRNLHTFVTDLGTTEAVVPHLPQSAILVSESGFSHANDFIRMAPLVHAFLVGESLSGSADPVTTLAGWRQAWHGHSARS